MNNISHDMNFTTDHQCKYDDRFLPTLDFKLKLVMKGIPKVVYRFFKKLTSNPLTILWRSPMPKTIKMATFSMEIS